MKEGKEKNGDKIYILKVTLNDWFGRVKGTPHRTFAIPGGFTLYGFAEEIIDAFGFDFDHCFGFFDNLKMWTKSIECYELFNLERGCFNTMFLGGDVLFLGCR